MATWNDAFNASPAGSADPGEGDDRIREIKSEVDGRSNQEHVWHDTATTGACVHRAGSACIYYQAATPTLRPDGVTALGTNDKGRIWMDSDDDTIKGVWTGAAFVTPGMSLASATLSGTLDVTGAVTLSSTLAVTGNTTIGGTCGITGDTTIGGALAVTGTLAVTGAATFTAGVSPVTDQGGGSALLMKVVEIGDWNMDATAEKTVLLGVASARVRSVSVLIRNDVDTLLWPLEHPFSKTLTYDGEVKLPSGYLSISTGYESEAITLVRVSGGSFDSSSFDATSYNRGYVTIWYTAT